MKNAVSMTFAQIVSETMSGSRFAAEENFIQHGCTSCLLHSIAVAYFCYCAAKKLGFLEFRLYELVRGALLHDYFLYDWHNTIPKNGLHGFSHPFTAFCNALSDFELSDVERDIITRHMFPLVPLIPLYKESHLVSIVDKFCSLYEVFARDPYKIPEIRLAHTMMLAKPVAVSTAF